MDILAKKFYAKFTEIQENGTNRVFGDSPIIQESSERKEEIKKYGVE